MAQFRLKLNDLSNARTEIMGFAILMLMLFHSGHLIPFGNVGVDIFLICSGVGIYYSLNNNKNGILKFYKKRLIRILPLFFISAFIYYFFIKNDKDFISLFYHLSTLDFWISGDLPYWYIPVILLFYFVSPILKHIIDSKYSITIPSFIFLLCAYIVFRCFTTYNCHLYIFIDRIPSYIMGMYLGNLLIQDWNNKELSTGIILVVVFVSIILFFLKYVGFPYSSFRVLLYPILALSLSFSCVLFINYFPYFRKIFNLCGIISLEIYLFHVQCVMEPLRTIVDNAPVRYLIAFFVSFPICYYIHYLFKRVCLFFNVKIN